MRDVSGALQYLFFFPLDLLSFNVFDKYFCAYNYWEEYSEYSIQIRIVVRQSRSSKFLLSPRSDAFRECYRDAAIFHGATLASLAGIEALTRQLCN